MLLVQRQSSVSSTSPVKVLKESFPEDQKMGLGVRDEKSAVTGKSMVAGDRNWGKQPQEKYMSTSRLRAEHHRY